MILPECFGRLLQCVWNGGNETYESRRYSCDGWSSLQGGEKKSFLVDVTAVSNVLFDGCGIVGTRCMNLADILAMFGAVNKEEKRKVSLI